MNIKKNFWKHILAILGVIAYEQTTILVVYRKIMLPEFVYYLVQVPFFYLCVYFMLFLHDRRTQWVKGIFLGIMLFVIFLFFQSLAASSVRYFETGQFEFQTNTAFYTRTFLRGIYIFFIGLAYFQSLLSVRRAKLANQRQLLLMEQERNQTELENAYLRSQINPHLLFNSLQFIQHQIDKGSPQASQAVHLLGELMHYSLKATSENNTVPLVDELAYVRQYVELASLRSDNRQHLQLNVNAEANSSNLQLPSGIIGNLVENVFKHGDLSEPNDPGMVVIELQDRKLFVQTHNRIRPISPYRTTGIGIDNIRKRLDLLYPERYTFRSREEDSHYNLYFEIIL